jgi:MFS family permease
MLKLSPQHRNAGLLALACFQNFTLGGITFGWSSLAVIFTKSGLSATAVQNTFVWSSSANLLAPLCVGYILDHFGPRACSAMCTFCVALGCAIFGSSQYTGMNPETAFSVGMVLIAFGGPGVQNSLFHLSNLFPARKSTATSTITGSFQVETGAVRKRAVRPSIYSD